MEYASKGLAGTALGFGIGGAAMSLANGGLSNLLGGLGQNNKSAAADVAAAVTPAMTVAAMLAARQQETSCSENTGVNRYELNQQKTLAEKDMEIAYWRGQDETNRKITDTYAKLESRIIELAKEVRANKDEQNAVNMQQAVYNGTNTAAVACIQNQVNQLLGLTKVVVPNSSVCPGWGTATVSVSTGTTTTG